MSLKYKNSQGEWVQIPIPSEIDYTTNEGRSDKTYSSEKINNIIQNLEHRTPLFNDIEVYNVETRIEQGNYICANELDIYVDGEVLLNCFKGDMISVYMDKSYIEVDVFTLDGGFWSFPILDIVAGDVDSGDCFSMTGASFISDYQTFIPFSFGTSKNPTAITSLVADKVYFATQSTMGYFTDKNNEKIMIARGGLLAVGKNGAYSILDLRNANAYYCSATTIENRLAFIEDEESSEETTYSSSKIEQLINDAIADVDELIGEVSLLNG